MTLVHCKSKRDNHQVLKHTKSLWEQKKKLSKNIRQ